MQEGSKAPQAAGRIHTDFERGFIMVTAPACASMTGGQAETMKFEDLKEMGNEAAVGLQPFTAAALTPPQVKAGGKYIQNGKNYTVQDGGMTAVRRHASPRCRHPLLQVQRDGAQEEVIAATTPVSNERFH